jgi:hypothetical protein
MIRSARGDAEDGLGEGSDKAKVVGRWHDNRHTLVTELAESGAGDEVIMSIAGTSLALFALLSEGAARQIQHAARFVAEMKVPRGNYRLRWNLG